MNLPVDRVDVHIGYHWLPICSLFAFGKAVDEQIVGQGMAKSKFFAPGIFCCAQDLFVPSSSGMRRRR